MSTAANPAFERQQAGTLVARLSEPRRFLQVVAGARQVGKTTLVGQVVSRLDIPSVFISADEPTVGDTAWLAAQWERGRLAAADAGKAGAVLVLDEVQKIPRWSETVKRLWDEDSRARRPLKVALLGSAPLLMQQGLTESLAGRFEIVHLPHWSFAEMARVPGRGGNSMRPRR
jgi:predicted AAA+ superfamily ATPase